MPRGGVASLVSLATAAILAGCELTDGPNRIVIPLDELNGSGVSGTATLEPLGDRLTRISVEFEGGRVTGAWINVGTCETGRELATIKPPEGRSEHAFEFYVEALEHGLSALFLDRGRYVACGSA